MTENAPAAAAPGNVTISHTDEVRDDIRHTALTIEYAGPMTDEVAAEVFALVAAHALKGLATYDGICFGLDQLSEILADESACRDAGPTGGDSGGGDSGGGDSGGGDSGGGDGGGD